MFGRKKLLKEIERLQERNQDLFNHYNENKQIQSLQTELRDARDRLGYKVNILEGILHNLKIVINTTAKDEN